MMGTNEEVAMVGGVVVRIAKEDGKNSGTETKPAQCKDSGRCYNRTQAHRSTFARRPNTTQARPPAARTNYER